MVLALWPDRILDSEGDNAGCPSLTPYLLDGPGPHPVIVVFPGGGYMSRADHEGEPIARWLNGIGASAVVLNYSVAPRHYPTQYQEAQRAVRLVRHQAAEWHLDVGRVGVLGFSAGGHLASTVGTHFDAGDPGARDPIDRLSSRPDLSVLCYPVVTLGRYTHADSRAALLGDRQQDEALIALLSNELQVTADTPPTFLWHTANDAAVPVENSVQFAAALAQHKVPFELHVFEQGTHGLGLATEYPGVGAWAQLCATWLERRRFIGDRPLFDAYSTFGDLRRDERALAVLRRHLPHLMASPDLDRANEFPLRILASFVNLNEEALKTIEADLSTIT